MIKEVIFQEGNVWVRDLYSSSRFSFGSVIHYENLPIAINRDFYFQL